MNATLSTRQLRLVGLLVLAVVVGGGFLVVTRHKSTTPTTASSTPAVTTPAQTTPAQTTPSQNGHTHTATPTKLATHGLPVQVARALQKHSVVVVAMYLPGSSVDSTTAAEAQAGAKEMHVGFVKLNVQHQASGVALLRKLGVVNTPVVLVVKRPASITSEFKGFVDRNVVAQAVADAR